MSLCRLTSPPRSRARPAAGRVGCLLAGALAGAPSPPTIWPLILPALAVLCLAARRLAPGAAFRAGWLWGLALAAGQLNWILVVLTEYGDLSWFLAVPALLILTGYLALYPAAFAALLARLGRGGIGQMVAAPVAWLGLEWLRGEALTGFPWLPLGAALTGELRLIQGAELVGALGLSGLLVLLGALLARALERGTLPGRLACLAAGAALLALGWFWGGERIAAVRAAMDRAPRLTVSVVQGDVPIRELWDPRRRLAIVERHLALTRSQAGGVGERPWLVVWSESAAPFVFGRDPLPSELILAGARDLAADIIFGTIGLVPKDGQNRLTNRSALATARGEPGGEYDKVHLVPFGEYVPWGRVLFFVRALATGVATICPARWGARSTAGGWSWSPDLLRVHLRRAGPGAEAEGRPAHRQPDQRRLVRPHRGQRPASFAPAVAGGGEPPGGGPGGQLRDQRLHPARRLQRGADRALRGRRRAPAAAAQGPDDHPCPPGRPAGAHRPGTRRAGPLGRVVARPRQGGGRCSRSLRRAWRGCAAGWT